MADLSLNSLSVEAIRKEQEGQREDKLRSQAANNVFRQKSAAELRGDVGKKPSSSSSKPSAPSRPPKEKTPDEEAKELADLIEKVTAFKSNPVLAPKLISIAMPRNGTIAEYRLCYEQIKNRLAQGMAGHSIRQTYLQGMAFAVPFLESEKVSDSIRLPPNSYQYLSACAAEKIDPNTGKAITGSGRFDPEFEELAIEFSKFFRSGPIPRLIFGTFGALMEYKALVGAGFIDPRTGVPTPEMQAAMSQSQAQEQPSPQPQPEVAQPEILHPPPMRLYPAPTQETYAQIEPESFAPEFGMPIISSRESLPIDDGIGVGSFIDDLPAPTKKKSSRGRRV